MTDHQREACRPARPVPLMAVAGTADPVQSSDGWLLPSGRLLSVPETLEFWRTLHGCTGQTGKPLPHREPTDTTRVALIEWTGCRTPGALRLYCVEGGGHHAPRGRRPAHGHRFAAQLGPVPLFDGRIEGVHVQMNNSARGRASICGKLRGHEHSSSPEFSTD